MWAVEIDRAGRLSEVRAPRPVPGSGEVLVRVLAAGIDTQDLAGWVRRPLAGAMPARCCPERTLVGTVEQADPEHAALRGCPVAVMMTMVRHETGSFDSHLSASQLQVNAQMREPWLLAEWVSVPAAAVVPLASGRPMEEAPLLRLAASTLCAVRQTRVEIGESVAVLGTDLALILAAQWVRVAGAYDVYIVDDDPRGLALARQLWLGERIDADSASASSALRALRDGHGVDLAIVLTADAERLRIAMDLVEPGGRVLALTRTAAECLADRASTSRTNVARLIKASTDGAGASHIDWQIAARTWGSGRLALRDLVTERVFVKALVARANAGLTGDEGFIVALAPDRV